MEDFRSKLDKYLNEYYKDSGFMGIVRVTSKGEIIYNSSVGYANIEAKTQIDQNSVFNFYSMSKPLCAMGLMLLYEKGLIDLNNHPSVYVPEAKGFDKNLNISHLLNHTSGIPDFEQEKAFADKYISGPNEKIREHLMLITEYPSHFKPGEGQMYANVNFVLCALIIENVSGMNYYDYMKKEVFTPLEMKTATFDVLYNNNEKRVMGYERVNGIVTDIESSKDWLYGAGDIVGTMDDAAALYRALKYKLLLKPERGSLY
ncbi:MAG: serine hydrolase [Clostridia bacterium]|nr:serine hydrolase [Clostridia bacterium]